MRVEVIPRGRSTVESVVERLPYAALDLALLFLVVQALWYADVGGFVGLLGGAYSVTGTPFLSERTFALLVLGATAVATGWTWGGVQARVAGGVAAALAVAWLLPFEIRPGYAVAGWAALVLGGLVVARRIPAARFLAGQPALGLGAFATLVTLLAISPPDRLIVDESTVILGWPLLTDATVALAALALAIGIGALVHRAERLSLPALVVAGCVGVYLLSVAVVDTYLDDFHGKTASLQRTERGVDRSNFAAVCTLVLAQSGWPRRHIPRDEGRIKRPERVYAFHCLPYRVLVHRSHIQAAAARAGEWSKGTTSSDRFPSSRRPL